MLALETKQSGGKLLPHSDLRGRECFQGKYPAAGKEGRNMALGMLGVCIGQGHLRQQRGN